MKYFFSGSNGRLLNKLFTHFAMFNVIIDTRKFERPEVNEKYIRNFSIQNWNINIGIQNFIFSPNIFFCTRNLYNLKTALHIIYNIISKPSLGITYLCSICNKKLKLDKTNNLRTKTNKEYKEY